MRLSQKKEILRVLVSMCEVHDQLPRLLADKQYRQVADLLYQCQNCAIYVGNLIEASEGPSTSVVRHLEQYCNMLYNTVLNIRETGNAEILPKKLHSYLMKVRDSVTVELPSRYEIVFFPYKASMWDSLESIWKASREDPLADVYVVPLPYFDINSDGSLGRLHEESDQYPSYVPVTSWKEYRPSEHNPEIVFIHNPYDNCNLVTSLHPEFYSCELKKCTSFLVYVPYFISTDNVEDHFCSLPGVLYADRVIVQSENVRQTYIKNVRLRMKETDHSCSTEALNQKFLAIGSPKFDKLRHAMLKQYDIPAEWKQKIYKNVGKRKKVVLYNTTVTALLNGEDKKLLKIQETIQIFKKNSNIVLLWRPHPLSEATCSAQCPMLFPKYKLIVEKYRSEDWVIYDDTPELHRAIAISDAYYGDMSSLVALYRVTGKPVMIEDPELINGDFI